MATNYTLTVDEETDLTLSVDNADSVELSVAESVEMFTVDDYMGEYEYTPTAETQTVSIEGLRASQDIVINPIPSNYGLITWDGSTLTVS